MTPSVSTAEASLADAALLAMGAVHDLRNLLVAVLGNTELVLDDPSLDPEHRGALGDAVVAARGAAALTDQILQFSRMGSASFDVIPFSEIVELLQPIVRLLVPATTRVRWHVPAELPSVRIDRGQFIQLAMNLLTNAVRATSGQPNWIELSVAEEHGAIDERSYVRFAVRDTGVGIAAENLNRVFEIFFTTHVGCAGIGLANVKRIAELHGGSVSVQSELGRGSTFAVRLPVVPTSVDLTQADA